MKESSMPNPVSHAYGAALRCTVALCLTCSSLCLATQPGEEVEIVSKNSGSFDLSAAANRMISCAVFTVHPLLALDWPELLSKSGIVTTYYRGGTYPSSHYLEHPPKYEPESAPYPFARELATRQAQSAEAESLPVKPAEVETLPLAPRVDDAEARPNSPTVISEPIKSEKATPKQNQSEDKERQQSEVKPASEDAETLLRRLVAEDEENQWKRFCAPPPRSDMIGAWDFYLGEATDIPSLLEKCHDAVLSGRQGEADALARRAVEMNRDAVLAHPLTRKMGSLSDILPVPAPLVEGNEERELQRATERWTEEQTALSRICATCGYDEWDPSSVKLVNVLVEESYAAFQRGKRKEAETLLGQAMFRYGSTIADHPLVAKMTPLREICNEPQAYWPPCDVGIPTADNLFLQIAHQPFTVESGETTPPESIVSPVEEKEESPAVLEVDDEACELELVPDPPDDRSPECGKKDADRPRVQVQLGPWSFKLAGEGKGNRSMTFSWTVVGSVKETK
jgi:hypothetical protein